MSVHDPPWLFFEPFKAPYIVFNLDPDTDPVFLSNVDLDPNPASQNNADSDPQTRSMLSVQKSKANSQIDMLQSTQDNPACPRCV